MFFIGYFMYLNFKWYTSSQVSLCKLPSPMPLLLWGCSPPTHALPHYIPLHWGIKPSQDQGPLLPLMSDKAILCYICSWSHGSLQVSSLVGGLFPGSSGGSGWLILLFFLWGCKPLQFLLFRLCELLVSIKKLSLILTGLLICNFVFLFCSFCYACSVVYI